MFEICLFDLDDTLVRTEDLKDVREACKQNALAKNIGAVKTALASGPERRIYSLKLLKKIRAAHPQLKLGVFTRSPRSYADTVLDWAYPGFQWDIVVAYEDVEHTKPHGDGIDQAMEKFGVTLLDQVVLVGDNDTDVRAAYNCGCMVTLDKSAWPYKWLRDHWRALGHVPDAVIDDPDGFLDVLERPNAYLPELERLLTGTQASAQGVRFDKVGHFIPKEAGGGTTSYPIYVCGRSFAAYGSLKWRKKWHGLTKSIEDHKDADVFPDAWIDAIRNFIAAQYIAIFDDVHVLMTVVPHRPERKARLEQFLKQLAQSLAAKPLDDIKVTFAPSLLAYKSGVKSQHGEHLSATERAVNVRDHLFVKQPDLANGASVLVLDDVVTTGASLIFASKYLKSAGASEVKCLALAKNISDVLAWTT